MVVGASNSKEAVSPMLLTLLLLMLMIGGGADQGMADQLVAKPLPLFELGSEVSQSIR